MARVAGVNIPDNKKIVIALTYVYGIGKNIATKILTQAQIDPNLRTNALATGDFDKIRNVIENNFKVEGDLRMMVSQNIKRLKEVGSYRGMRHAKNLPAHGQRTKTNARTRRGKRVCVGSGRRVSAEKT